MEEDNIIAIKKIERVFEHRVFTKRTLRELKILRMCEHENVFKIQKINKYTLRLSIYRIYNSQNQEKNFKIYMYFKNSWNPIYLLL